MTNVCNKQADKQSAPDPQIRRRAEDESFDDGETEVQVRQLREDDVGGGGDAGLGAGGQVGEVEVGLLEEGGVVGADDGGDGFDVEEEVFVDFGGLWSSCSHVEILVALFTTRNTPLAALSSPALGEGSDGLLSVRSRCYRAPIREIETYVIALVA